MQLNNPEEHYRAGFAIEKNLFADNVMVINNRRIEQFKKLGNGATLKITAHQSPES